MIFILQETNITNKIRNRIIIAGILGRGLTRIKTNNIELCCINIMQEIGKQRSLISIFLVMI